MKSIASTSIAALLLLFTGCRNNAGDGVAAFISDVHSGHYSRSEALLKADQLPISPEKRNSLRERTVREIAQRELESLRSTEPAVAALIDSRNSNPTVTYDNPHFTTGLSSVSTFRDFDTIVSQARTSTSLATAKLSHDAKIVVNGNTVQIVSASTGANANGNIVETSLSEEYPLSWVKTYAPQLIQ